MTWFVIKWASFFPTDCQPKGCLCTILVRLLQVSNNNEFLARTCLATSVILFLPTSTNTGYTIYSTMGDSVSMLVLRGPTLSVNNTGWLVTPISTSNEMAGRHVGLNFLGSGSMHSDMAAGLWVPLWFMYVRSKDGSPWLEYDTVFLVLCVGWSPRLVVPNVFRAKLVVYRAICRFLLLSLTDSRK